METKTVFLIVIILFLSAAQTEEEHAAKVLMNVIFIHKQIAGLIKRTRRENSALFLIFRMAALLSGRHETDQIPAGKYKI